MAVSRGLLPASVGLGHALGFVGAAPAGETSPPLEMPAQCLSVSDGCRVCKLTPRGEIVGCSCPGIACGVGPWTCTEPLATPVGPDPNPAAPPPSGNA
jgi:hypothetical protein